MSTSEEIMTKSGSVRSTDSNVQQIGHEYWERDASVTHCSGCSAEFGTFKWKHHCRVCGKIFCDSCTATRIAVHRCHYAENTRKMKRVCGQCALNKDEALKFLETVKERAHLGYVHGSELSVGETDSSPSSRENMYYECLDDSALYMEALEPSEVCQARPAKQAVVGLPRIVVSAVDERQGCFFFEPRQLAVMVGVSESVELDGSTFSVIQIRHGKRVWSGSVVVSRAGDCYSSRRATANAHDQWHVDDVIIYACEAARNWHLEDAFQLGTEISMFDDTLQRLDVDAFPSVTVALRCLNVRIVACPEGICIVHSSSQSQYFLLVREDRKLQSFKLFEGFRNWDAKSNHKFWWCGA